MIGKAQWFTRRKWGGWGLFPVTWQGWVYVGMFIALMFGTSYLPFPQKTNLIILGVIGVVLVLDTIDIMFRMKKDEREMFHEAVAERNALWVIISILAVGVAYEAAHSVVETGVAYVDPVIIAAFIGGLIAKAVTNYYLDKKD